jgi:hypothetical protein
VTGANTQQFESAYKKNKIQMEKCEGRKNSLKNISGSNV